MKPSNGRRTTAQELLRELLGEARREVEREEAKGERLRALVRAGKASGLGVTELAETAGLSRPGVYEILKRKDPGPAEDLDDIVLAAIAAGGATTRAALESALRIDDRRLSATIERLAGRHALSFGTAGYDAKTMEEIVMLGPAGEPLLQQRLRRALSSRPEHWTVYIALAEEEVAEIGMAAESRFGSGRTTVLPATTTSAMEGPELAIAFDVADAVGLFNEAAAAWHEIRLGLDLEPAPVRVTAFSPPRLRSATLEAIGRGVAEANPKIERKVMRIVADAVPQVDELTICVRVLTEAATALRKTVGQKAKPPSLSTGDQAFEELQAVVGLHLDPPREEIQRALIPALERATDRLGPIPGGQLGSFRATDGAPHVVEDVIPTPTDLVEICKAAGRALGYAQIATQGTIDACEIVSALADG